MEFVIILLWIILSFVVASAARNRNRSYGGYLLLSLLVSPLIAEFIIICLARRECKIVGVEYRYCIIQLVLERRK